MSRLRTHQQGFTIPELLVVIGILAAGAILAAIFLRPASYETDFIQAERQLAAAHMTQALTKYRAETGAWPAGLAKDAKVVGTEEGQLDLCAALVPKYAEDMPIDPLIGYKMEADKETYTADKCTEGVFYDSALKVSLSDDSQHVTVATSTVETFIGIKITR